MGSFYFKISANSNGTSRLKKSLKSQLVFTFIRSIRIRSITKVKVHKLRPYSTLADLGLPAAQLNEIIQMGNFGDEFNFDNFTGVACLTLSGSVSHLL